MNHLTDEQLNAAIHAALPEEWLILKRGYYYRPDAKGYTNRIEEAWRVPLTIAKQHERPHGEPVTIRPVPPRNYCGSLDVLHSVITTLDYAKQSLFEHFLGELTKTYGMALRRAFVGERFRLANAGARIRAEALFHTLTTTP